MICADITQLMMLMLVADDIVNATATRITSGQRIFMRGRIAEGNFSLRKFNVILNCL